jgi:hypothetical protein
MQKVGFSFLGFALWDCSEMMGFYNGQKDLRDEIENNMQPKTLTLVFDDAVNDLTYIRVGDLSVKNFKKIRFFPSPYRNLKIAYGIRKILVDSDFFCICKLRLKN